MIDFRLKVFCSVARNLSFTKASHELFISQPAISKHIQEIEQEYGVRLFDRNNNRITLTHAGEVLLTHAEEILGRYRQLDFDMHMLSHEHVGELRLGASTTIAQYVLPAYLATFSAKFRQIKLSLINGNTVDIERAVDEQRIDVGLVEGRSRQQHLRYTPFMRDELVLVASTRSKWAYTEEVTPEELLRLPLVIRENGSGSLDVIEHTLNTHHIRLAALNIVMQLGSTESIKQYIIHADCLAIISVQAVLNEITAGKLKVIDIAGITIEREFSFVQKMGETGGIAKGFISYMIENGQHL